MLKIRYTLNCFVKSAMSSQHIERVIPTIHDEEEGEHFIAIPLKSRKSDAA